MDHEAHHGADHAAPTAGAATDHQQHGGHDKHAGHDPAAFRRQFCRTVTGS